MKKIRKWITLVLVLAIVVVGVTYGKKLLSKVTSSSTVTTQIYTVTQGNLVSTISPTGQVEATTSEALSFDVSGVTLLELNVSAGQEVKAGDLLAQLDTEPLQLTVDAAEASVLSAQETLETAQSPYSDLEVAAATLAVTQAQTALEQAQAALDELLNPDIESAEAAVAQAAYSLSSAQLNLEITQHGNKVGKTVRELEYTVSWHERQLRNLETQLAAGTVEQDDVDTESQTLADLQADLAAAQATATLTLTDAQDRVADAQEALATAKENLADLQAGPDELELTQANNKVAKAEYNLAKAQEAADEIAAGPSEKNVQLAQAKYDAAVATLEEAQLALDSATMVAPFDGTIVSVGAEEGDEVSSGTTIVTLADLNDLRVVASIDETEITKISVGMEATITFDSLTGQTFTGKVLEIPLESTLSNNVVTYEVPVSLEGAEDADVRSGMTANITFVTGQKQNVLVLPLLAVQESDSGTVVTLSDGTTTPVEIGIDNGSYVEIVAGLNAGDQVMVSYDTSDEEEETSTGSSLLGGVSIGVSGGGSGMPSGGMGR